MRVLRLDHPTGREVARRFFGAQPTGTTVLEPAEYGDAGEQQLANKIQAAIVEGGKDPELRDEVLRAIRGVHGSDTQGMVTAWFDYVADDRRFPYRRDPVSVQIIPAVRDALRSLGRDCKGKTILLGAGLESIGIEVRVVTVDQHPAGLSDREPANRHHVYLEWLRDDGTWEPLDAVLRLLVHDAGPGDELPWSSRRTFSDGYADE